MLKQVLPWFVISSLLLYLSYNITVGIVNKSQVTSSDFLIEEQATFDVQAYFDNQLK